MSGLSPRQRSSSAASRTSSTGSEEIFNKLTDPRLFTGSHKHRFDEEGLGKGLAGRDAAGNAAVPYRGGRVHDISQIMRPGFHSPTRETRVISHAQTEEERLISVRNMSPRRGSDAVAQEDLSRMSGLSPRSRAGPASSPRPDPELRRHNSLPVALASVQRRYREMFDRKSAPTPKQEQPRAAAPPSSLSLAELEQRERDDDSPPPPDLETPHHSVVLEAAPEDSVAKPWHDSPAMPAQQAAAAAGAVEVGSPDSEASADGIDTELWCKAVTMALAFRGFRQGCEVSRTERRQAEDNHRELQATKAELAVKASENVRLQAELAAVKQQRDQAVRSLRGQEAQKSELKQATADRDEAVRELQSVKGERSSLVKQTEQLAAELNQLREDWFASWEAEQALSVSASAEQQEKVSLGDDNSPASQERDESYLKYLKVEKAGSTSTLEDTVDLSWWQPTPEEEKRRQTDKDTSKVPPLAQLQGEWAKVRTTQEELRQMQTKVDAKRTRLRRQLAQHGWSADGDEIHVAPRRKYVEQ